MERGVTCTDISRGGLVGRKVKRRSGERLEREQKQRRGRGRGELADGRSECESSR